MIKHKKEMPFLIGIASCAIGFLVQNVCNFFQGEIFESLYGIKNNPPFDSYPIVLIASFLNFGILFFALVISLSINSKKMAIFIGILDFFIGGFWHLLTYHISSVGIEYYKLFNQIPCIFMIIGQIALFYGLYKIGKDANKNELNKGK